jgi:hypothetical protein
VAEPALRVEPARVRLEDYLAESESN